MVTSYKRLQTSEVKRTYLSIIEVPTSMIWKRCYNNKLCAISNAHNFYFIT